MSQEVEFFKKQLLWNIEIDEKEGMGKQHILESHFLLTPDDLKLKIGDETGVEKSMFFHSTEISDSEALKRAMVAIKSNAFAIAERAAMLSVVDEKAFRVFLPIPERLGISGIVYNSKADMFAPTNIMCVWIDIYGNCCSVSTMFPCSKNYLKALERRELSGESIEQQSYRGRLPMPLGLRTMKEAALSKFNIDNMLKIANSKERKAQIYERTPKDDFVPPGLIAGVRVIKAADRKKNDPER